MSIKKQSGASNANFFKLFQTTRVREITIDEVVQIAGISSPTKFYPVGTHHS